MTGPTRGTFSTRLGLRPRHLGFALAVLTTCVGVPTHAQAPAARVPVVVELFTSEGCSSCPPADALLTKLMQGSPVPNIQPITLSEHVDYWDQDGWRDPFSSASFTARQHAYAGPGNDDQVYTPQMIVDGSTAFIGSDTRALVAALTKAAASAKAPVTMTWVEGAKPAVSVTIAANTLTSRSAVVLAITEDGLSSAVKRGENAGRTLAHTSVTRRLNNIGQTTADGSFQLEVPVKLDSSWNRSALKLVVFAQSASHHVTAAGVIPVPAR